MIFGASVSSRRRLWRLGYETREGARVTNRGMASHFTALTRMDRFGIFDFSSPGLVSQEKTILYTPSGPEGFVPIVRGRLHTFL